MFGDVVCSDDEDPAVPVAGRDAGEYRRGRRQEGRGVMERLTCRYCGIAIDSSGLDQPEDVVPAGAGLAHECCVYHCAGDTDLSRSLGTAEHEYQQARARGPISGG